MNGGLTIGQTGDAGRMRDGRVYIYDGSFEGFLCAVAHGLDTEAVQLEFAAATDNRNLSLFCGEEFEVPTVRETALNFRKRFITAVSREAFATVRYAFHSRQPGIETLLWRYLSLGLETGRSLDSMLTREPVRSVHGIARRVAREAHKFKGFVRFREVSDGFLYAAIEPDFDILPLIASHFTTRIGDRPWVIHDLKRAQAAAFDGQTWRLVQGIEQKRTPALTDEEQAFTMLWQRYFKHLAIDSRCNPKLQQQHVPLKYRTHLTEFTVR